MSGMRGLAVVVGTMLGFMALVAALASVVSP
ncbi:hypothetical protein FHX37_4080 [Haloactinospora alba]|uniref:Uncharacterized protein n=1 Tax=Haloactinospora alba TaxID=405555 RepID=A0A543NA92_9ACTN|nr:hypothetical protein FHX37_4080 [Haloactinospora alba]